MKKKKNIIAVMILVILVLSFIGLVYFNPTNNSNEKKKVEANRNQLKLFTEAMNKDFISDEVETVCSDTTNDSEKLKECATLLITKTIANDTSYPSVATTSLSLDLKNTISSATGSASDLLTTLKNKLGNLDLMGFVSETLYGTEEGAVDKTKTMTLSSNTVCNTVADKEKYCLDGNSKKLSANVYVKKPDSGKWVVVVHPFMTNGELMYNAVGSFYSNADYNVLAPDLRGFGNSDGSVAMGYLESLDIYDWIKDLNQNYKNYGVNIAPDTIIVHGISLGGATTVQLATNTDINGNFDNLHIKGFVDDCGYTSMSGIITGMLSVGDISSLTSLTSSLGIDYKTFMTEVETTLSGLGISGLKGFDLSTFKGLNGLTTQVSGIIEKVTTGKGSFDINSAFSNANWSEISKYGNAGALTDYFNNPTGQWPTNGQWSENYGTYKPTTPNEDTIKDSLKDTNSKYQECINNGGNPMTCAASLRQTSTSINNSKLTLINDSKASDDNFLNGVVGKVLMKLVGVGLTEENYEKYSNSFSTGRGFTKNSKVLVIHGTSDTTVPPSHGDEIANAAKNQANLFFQWKAQGQPHAFVVIGKEREKYSNLIQKFIGCVENNNCETPTGY